MQNKLEKSIRRCKQPEHETSHSLPRTVPKNYVMDKTEHSQMVRTIIPQTPNKYENEHFRSTMRSNSIDKGAEG